MEFESLSDHGNKEADKKYAKSEMRAIIHSIMACTRDKKKHFIDPIDEHKLPKLKQLNIAKKYFKILNYEFSILKKKINFNQSITKPLNSAEVGYKTLFTTKVNQDELSRPYPWFIQDAVTGGRDVTCVYIKGEVFFYYCDYKRSAKKIDWRTEINKKDADKWMDVIPYLHAHLENRYGEEGNKGTNKAEEVTEYVNRIRLYYETLSLIEKSKLVKVLNS
jgi:hypothetical protein